MIAPRLSRLWGPVRRPDLRVATITALASVVFAVLCGVGWGLLAPSRQLFVVEPDQGVPLTGESAHTFDALAMFLCAGAVVGAVTAIAAWQWRRVRGPVLFAGILVGTVIGGLVMWAVGEAVARLHHPQPLHPAVHSIVAPAPIVGSDLGWCAAPFVASVVIVILVMLSPRDDLGVAPESTVHGAPSRP